MLRQRLRAGARTARTGRWSVATAVLLALTAGCSSDPPPAPPAPTTYEPPAYAYAPCSFITDGNATDAACATIELPLDWMRPAGRRVPVFVKRLAATAPRRGALWLINGGMVSSGVDLEAAARQFFAVIAPDLDLYLPDHRGTGRSARLGCAAAEAPGSDGGAAITPAELPACVAELQTTWGADLARFNTTDAARDLGWLMARHRTSGDSAFVYGISYGSFLVQRYLTLFPDQPTGAMLDGLCLPGACFMSRIDAWLDDLGARFFAACQADMFCAGKLGADPWAEVTATLASLDTGHCPEAVAAGLTRARTRETLGGILGYLGWTLRPAAAALVYRLRRCNAGDVAALTRFARAFVSPAPPSAGDRLASALTGYNVAFSELWEDPPPAIDAQEARVAAANAATGASLSLARARPPWPIPPRIDVPTWASTATPMLMLHGSLDFIPTEGARTGGQRFIRPGQHFIEIPRAPHATVLAPTTSGRACASILMQQFLAAPAGALDTSCVDQVQPIRFDSIGAYAQTFFGTADFWEGTPGN